MKKFKKLSYPYIVWMFILVVVPIIAMLVLSFCETEGMDFSTIKFSLNSFKEVLDPLYLTAFWNSLKIAAVSTFFCFLIGYPVAYFISTSKIRHKMALIMVIILPMWSNMLLRIVAWEKVFYPSSILNMFGISLDLIGTEFAVIFGTITMYLPFMILPIFTVLEKIDKSLLEASSDLGVSKAKTFLKVVFPMSLKGVVSGTIMVFLPAATGFAICERLGGGKIIMIGNIIESMFKRAFNYSMGSLLSIIVLAVIMGVMAIMSKVDESGETLL